MAADQKMSQKSYDYWYSRIAKTSVIIYALIFLIIILLDSDVSMIFRSTSALSSFSFTKQKQALKPCQNPHLPNEEINTEKNYDDGEENEEDPLIPPPNITKAERIAWFRTQIPKLEILKSSNYSSTASFHLRILSFLAQNCSTFFHTIWLSPAKSFGIRELMTIDTLLKVHPQACLVILSRTMESKTGYRILKPLIDSGLKVQAVAPDLPFLVKKTPAESWLEQIKSGNKDPGSIPLSHNLSNLMRLAMLYKYGGIYLETDLIFVKDLSHLRNAIGATIVDIDTKKWLRLNSAIMIFDMHHPILLDFLDEFATTFDGSRWGYNGPELVSRVVERFGDTPGYNLTILPPSAFYSVEWNKIKDYYGKPKTQAGLIWVNNRLIDLLYGGKSYALYLWNKRTLDLDIEEGSVMARLFTDHCVVCRNVTMKGKV